MTKNLTWAGTDNLRNGEWEPSCFFGKTNPCEVLHQKLKGLHGYGPGVFSEQEREVLLLELKSISDSLKKFRHLKTNESTHDLAELILGISRHVDYQSFQIADKKEHDIWVQIHDWATKISEMRGKAHLYLGSEIYELSHKQIAQLHHFVIEPQNKQKRTTPDLMASAIDKAITELNANRRTEKPTKQEQMLQMLQSRPNYEARLEDLAPIFSGGSDPERLAQQKISELNAKLASFGIQIERFPIYQVVPINIKK